MPSSSFRARHTALAAALGIFALAAALRFAFLDTQSFWLDEAVAVRLVELDLGDLLRRVYDDESTPPLFYVVGWAWAKLFGIGEVGLRSLSAIAGTGFVVVAYLTGRRLVSERTGLIAAGLAAVNPLLIYYSQETRAYSLLMLFGGLSLLGFVCARERPGGRALAGWALASALALASHYYAFFLVAPEAVWLAAIHRRRAAPAIAAVGVVGLALLPLALHQRGLDHAYFLRETSLVGRVARLPKQFLVGFEGPAETLLAMAAGLLALAGVALALRVGKRARRAALVVGVLALGAVALPLPIDPGTFGTRNALAAWLPAALVVATGFACARPRRLGLALALALGAVGLATTLAVNLDRARGRDDWRGAAESLGSPPPGGRIVVVGPSQGRIPLGLYLPGLGPLPVTGAEVSEVATVGIDPDGPGSADPPPRPEPPFSPPAPMRLVRRDYASGYSVAVFRSPRPVRLTANVLPSLAPGEPAARFLQRP